MRFIWRGTTSRYLFLIKDQKKVVDFFPELCYNASNCVRANAPFLFFMKPNFVHFYQIPFTGLGLHGGYRGDQWLRNRIRIFNNFVLPSLIAQGSRDFYVWFCWRPEEKENPIVKEFKRTLDKVEDFLHVHTFGGVLFWDDKYDDKTASERLLRGLEISLPELKDYVGDLPYVLVTLQPSDDMYLSSAAKAIKGKFATLLENDPQNTRRVVGWKKGYIMNLETKEIAEYLGTNDRTPEMIRNYPDTMPPFFTILFSNEEFMNPKKHYDYLGPYRSHEYIEKHFEYSELEGREFIVGCHGENISTIYNHPFKGRTLSKEETEDVLIKTGLFSAEPIELKKLPRVKIREFINKLPFLSLLKRIYGKLPPRYKII